MPFSEKIREEVRRKALFRCCRCQEIGIDIHHIVPQRAGGSDEIENAAPLCQNCHDKFGANPEKRKEITQMRNVWYEIVEQKYFSNGMERANSELLSELNKKLTLTKNELQELKELINYKKIGSIQQRNSKAKNKFDIKNNGQLKDGDILLCKGEGLIASIIKWGTGSAYSHIAIVVSAKLGLIVETLPEGGVRAVSIEKYKTKFDLYRVKKEYHFNHSNVVGHITVLLARKYDFISTLKLAGKILLKRFHLIKLYGLKMMKMKKAADELQEYQDYFCTELCYEAFRAGDLDIVPQVGDAEIVSPNDIASSPILEVIYTNTRH